MAEFNREQFNTDPKHQADRERFDAMVEDSTKRLFEKRKAENPEKDTNFFDWLFGGVGK